MLRGLGFHLTTHRRRWTAVITVVVAAFALIAGSKAGAQMAYTVMVDVSSASPDAPGHGIVYTDQSGAPAYNLHVVANDTVQWKVTGGGKTASGKVRLIVYFAGGTPSYSETPPKHAYEGLDGAAGGPFVALPTTPIKIQALNASYKYHVVVFDESKSPPTTYSDDPKIIVGSGQGLENAVERLTSEVQNLREQVKALKKEVQTLKTNEKQERK